MSRRGSPAVSGALGILVVFSVTVSMFFLDSLPFIGAGPTYQAEFTEAAGLRPDNEVRIAGVKVGKVTAVELDGDHVDVDFTVEDAWVGNETTAAIQIKTVLGQKYLALDPRGPDRLYPGEPIPLERTTSPYDVTEAFAAATQTVEGIDTDRLAQSMLTLSQAFSGTPAEIRASIDGVGRLSETIAGRDRELKKLLGATAETSKVLADRNAEFTRLISDGALLLGELNDRKEAISRLLIGTRRLSQQLTGLVQDNEEVIGPALRQLDGVVRILAANNERVDKALKLYEPFVRLYANVAGNGRWFDQAVVNLLPPGLPEVPDTRGPVRTVGGS